MSLWLEREARGSPDAMVWWLVGGSERVRFVNFMSSLIVLDKKVYNIQLTFGFVHFAVSNNQNSTNVTKYGCANAA